MELLVEFEGLHFRLEFLELDEHAPQFLKFKIDLSIHHPNGKFAYSADDVWFDTDMWDRFESSLKNGLHQESVFQDLSNYILMKLKKVDDHIDVLVTIHEPLIGKGEIDLCTSQKVDSDSGLISALRTSFTEFPKFW